MTQLTLIPRVTNMMNGTFRPECVIAGYGLDDIMFGPKLAQTPDEARMLALQLCDTAADVYRTRFQRVVVDQSLRPQGPW
jgi:hypothetical protein